METVKSKYDTIRKNTFSLSLAVTIIIAFILSSTASTYRVSPIAGHALTLITVIVPVIAFFFSYYSFVSKASAVASSENSSAITSVWLFAFIGILIVAAPVIVLAHAIKLHRHMLFQAGIIIFLVMSSIANTFFSKVIDDKKPIANTEKDEYSYNLMPTDSFATSDTETLFQESGCDWINKNPSAKLKLLTWMGLVEEPCRSNSAGVWALVYVPLILGTIMFTVSVN